MRGRSLRASPSDDTIIAMDSSCPHRTTRRMTRQAPFGGRCVCGTPGGHSPRHRDFAWRGAWCPLLMRNVGDLEILRHNKNTDPDTRR